MRAGSKCERTDRGLTDENPSSKWEDRQVTKDDRRQAANGGGPAEDGGWGGGGPASGGPERALAAGVAIDWAGPAPPPPRRPHPGNTRRLQRLGARRGTRQLCHTAPS